MNRAWAPTAVAGGIALLLVWLAGDPLALRPQDVRPDGSLWWAGDAFLRVPEITLFEPRGDRSTFPSRFRWKAVPGATEYELAIGRDAPGSPPLMQTGGPSTSVELEVDPGTSLPGQGAYVWEVRARRGLEYLARSVARFRVASGS